MGVTCKQRRVGAGMAADGVPALREIPDLRCAEETRLIDEICGDEEGASPTAFFQQIGDYFMGADATVIEGESDFLRRILQSRGIESRDFAPIDYLRDRDELFFKRFAIEFVTRGALAAKTTRRVGMIRHHIVVKERDHFRDRRQSSESTLSLKLLGKYRVSIACQHTIVNRGIPMQIADFNGLIG